MNHSTILIFQFLQDIIIFSEEAWCSQNVHDWCWYQGKHHALCISYLLKTLVFWYFLLTFSTFDFSRDSTNHCKDEISTTLHMEMNDVIYGSVIGNTTNPLLLEVDYWVICLYFCLSLCLLATQGNHLNIYKQLFNVTAF